MRWLRTRSTGSATLQSAKSYCRLLWEQWLHPLHLLGPVLLGCCRRHPTSLSSVIVRQPPLCQILLQIVVRAVITSAPTSWTMVYRKSNSNSWKTKQKIFFSPSLLSLLHWSLLSFPSLTQLLPLKVGQGCLMSPPCLESQGSHLIPLRYLLFCSSA